jgi:hypothetical protein
MEFGTLDLRFTEENDILDTTSISSMIKSATFSLALSPEIKPRFQKARKRLDRTQFLPALCALLAFRGPTSWV